MATVQEAYTRKVKPQRVPTNREVWWWFFMRVSGVLLVFLVLGHMAIMHVFGGGVERLNFNFVAARWDGVFWRTYDLLLLVLAMLHGANGARNVIDDHISHDWFRVAIKGALYALTFIFLALGILVIVTFDAAQMPGGG